MEPTDTQSGQPGECSPGLNTFIFRFWQSVKFQGFEKFLFAFDSVFQNCPRDGYLRALIGCIKWPQHFNIILPDFRWESEKFGSVVYLILQKFKQVLGKDLDNGLYRSTG